MYSSVPAVSLLLEAAVSAPPVRLLGLDNPWLFPILSRERTFTAEIWTRKVLWPRNSWADGHGLLVSHADADCKSAGTTGQMIPLSHQQQGGEGGQRKEAAG
jgi:hypothetical protein